MTLDIENAIQTLCAYGVPQDEAVFQKALNLAIRSLEAWEKVKTEISECLKAIDDIKLMGVEIELPQATERRVMTYKQCLEFIDKHLDEVKE